MHGSDLTTLVLIRLEWAILAYFIFVNSFYMVLFFGAIWAMVQHLRRTRWENLSHVLRSKAALSISILAPAYNEAATIAESVRALLVLYNPALEIVVVNDGSRDDTMAVLQDTFKLTAIHPIYQRQIPTQSVRGLYRSQTHPNLLVIDKDNGGKADALNVGLQLATGDLVCAMDADTLIEPEALLHMVRPFLLRARVVAVGGTIRVVNDAKVHRGQVLQPRTPRHFLAGVQTVEYLRAFLFGRLGWNYLGGNLIISGAFGLFRRKAVLAAGGYRHDTVGEDMELVLRLRRHGYEEGGPHQVDFIPDCVAWTEVPESLRVLGRQRDRWHRGLADVLWRHRRLLCNPRYGAMGLLSYPYFVGIELLAPIVEGLGLLATVVGLALGAINLPFAGMFLLTAYGLGLLFSLGTLGLEEWSFHRYESLQDRLLLVLWATLENCGYRQLTVFWRLRGLARFLRGRTDWGAMERRGFRSAASKSP